MAHIYLQKQFIRKINLSYSGHPDISGKSILISDKFCEIRNNAAFAIVI